jgi:hypothetical protein
MLATHCKQHPNVNMRERLVEQCGGAASLCAKCDQMYSPKLDPRVTACTSLQPKLGAPLHP